MDFDFPLKESYKSPTCNCPTIVIDKKQFTAISADTEGVYAHITAYIAMLHDRMYFSFTVGVGNPLNCILGRICIYIETSN